ncbi:late embryogenesis abundant (LEA) domain-containing protein [Klebsiella michiganensis]|nr:late embryogenesis abundant (LEA) domain-containing protein [Klebsiella michiganensis]
MKLWSKTLIASAVCLILAGCDDSSKVDANLDKAKDNAQQIKEAASDKAEAIKDEADKHIDAIKKQAADEANNLSSQASREGANKFLI